MRVLVCGSRSWKDTELIRTVLAGYAYYHFGALTVIHGGAQGADRIAGRVAAGLNDGSNAGRGVKVEEYPAAWETYGKRAGVIRNQQMLDEGKPDVVWAFTDKALDSSKGTAHMVRAARKAGVPVHVVGGIFK